MRKTNITWFIQKGCLLAFQALDLCTKLFYHLHAVPKNGGLVILGPIRICHPQVFPLKITTSPIEEISSKKTNLLGVRYETSGPQQSSHTDWNFHREMWQWLPRTPASSPNCSFSRSLLSFSRSALWTFLADVGSPFSLDPATRPLPAQISVSIHASSSIKYSRTHIRV